MNNNKYPAISLSLSCPLVSFLSATVLFSDYDIFHSRANLFHNMSLLLFSLSSNQTPAKKQCGEKRKANPIYIKKKRNRKWQDSWKRAASGEERLWPTNDEAKSSIGDHWVSSYVVECTTFKLEGITDQERSTLQEHCVKIAQAKKGPRQTDGAWLVKSLTQQQREKRTVPNSKCPC